MKNLFLLLCTTLLFLGCKKEDDIARELPIPPPTQTGAGTFGCVIDGKTFVHNDGQINCFYQLIEGEYFFGIQGVNDAINPSGVGLGLTKLTITQGQTFQLVSIADGNASGDCFFETSPTSGIGVTTNSIQTGEVTFTRFDFANNIVSGIFWFDVINPLTGLTTQIRAGRFDTRFTN